MRRRLGELARSLSAFQKRESLAIRLGFPVVAGILTEAFINEKTLTHDLDQAFVQALPESSDSSVSFTRTIDLLSALITKAENASGPVDCLLLFHDQRFEGNESIYLNEGTERLLVWQCAQRGSTLHGYLDGHGVLESACVQSGGWAFGWGTTAEDVARRVAESIGHVRLLQVQINAALAAALPIEVGEASEVPIRSVRTYWQHPDRKEPVNHYYMRQGLDWLRRAQESEELENQTRTLRCSQLAIKEDPWNAQAYSVGGRAARFLGDLGLSAENLQRALQLGATDDRTIREFSAVFRALGKPAPALQLIEHILRNERSRTSAVDLELARLHASTGNNETARDLYGQILLNGRDGDDVRAEFAGVLHKLGRDAEAADHYKKALSLNPNNVDGLLYLAEAAASKQDLEEARRLSHQVEAADPRNPNVHLTLGRIFEMAQDWIAASRSYSRAIDLAPERDDARYLLANVLAESGDIEKAVEMLRRWLDDNPGNSEGHRRFSDLLVRSGYLGEAAEALERGAPRASHDLYRDAAELRERRGEYGQALLDYRALLHSAPETDALRLREELATHIAALSLMVAGPARTNPTSLAQELRLPALERHQLNTAAKPPDESDSAIMIPGSVDLLARVIGLKGSILHSPNVLERLLSFVLEAKSPTQDDLTRAPLVRDILSHLRIYEAFVRHMQKSNLLPADLDLSKSPEAVFQLAGDAQTLRRTQDLLRFFGVALKSQRNRDNSISVELRLRESASYAARRQLLQNLGVNMLDRNLREIRIRLSQDKMPLLLGAKTWNEVILAGKRKGASGTLLERIISSAAASRLYLALASCSTDTRDGLVRLAAPGELLTYSEVLLKYGSYLEFGGGHILFPGSAKSWEELLGASQASSPQALLKALLSRDQGRAMMLYYALGSAKPRVQEYFTAPGRLQQIYQLLGTNQRIRAKNADRFDRPLTLARALRQLDADSEGLVFPIESDLAEALGLIPKKSAQGVGPVRLEAAQIENLLARGSPHPSTMELIRFLQMRHPEMLGAKTVDFIARESARAPAMLNLVLDLVPPAPLLDRYFAFARRLSEPGTQPINIDRIRTVQSLVHLLALITRQGSLPPEEGQKLLSSVLGRLDTREGIEFALEATSFISGELLPALTRFRPTPQGTDPILLALSPPEEQRELLFEGRRLRLDERIYRYERMKAAIQHQNYMPLPDLLEAFRCVREASGLEPATALAALRRAAAAIPAINLGQQATASLSRAVARGEAGQLLSKLDAAARSRTSQGLQELLSATATALHTELGVTLLTYCYAFYGSPEADLLAFDPYLVRKHDFSPRFLTSAGCWTPAALVQAGDLGSYCAGSISGLGLELARLETAQAFQNFGRREGRSLVPTLLVGLRTVPRDARTDRAQKYVALSVRVGRELLAKAALDDSLYRWCEQYLSSQIPPLRREEVLASIRSGIPLSAAEALSPSELFLMGKEYRAGSELRVLNTPASSSTGTQTDSLHKPRMSAPTIERLRQLGPTQSSPQAHGFQREIEQYGPLLLGRMGLSQTSFEPADAFERIETEFRDSVLFDRICDLKIRLAEINYSLGLPAWVGEVEGELALREILPRAETIRTNSWALVLEQITKLGTEKARAWIEELVHRGILAPPAELMKNGGSSAP